MDSLNVQSIQDLEAVMSVDVSQSTLEISAVKGDTEITSENLERI